LHRLPAGGTRAGDGDAGCADNRARIRREHLAKGKSINEIVRELKVSRNAVRKVPRSGATCFEYAREGQPLPKLGPSRAELGRMLTTKKRRARASG